MTSSPEADARQEIDRQLQTTGWIVQDRAEQYIHADPGVAMREFPLPGHGFADYLLYVDGRATGVVEAKPAGTTLTGVELQARRYADAFPGDVPAQLRPLPLLIPEHGGGDAVREPDRTGAGAGTIRVSILRQSNLNRAVGSGPVPRESIGKRAGQVPNGNRVEGGEAVTVAGVVGR